MSTYSVPLDADVVSLRAVNDDSYNDTGNVEIDLPSTSLRATTQPMLRVNIGFDTMSPNNVIFKCTAGGMTVGTSTLTTYTIAAPGNVSYSLEFFLDGTSTWRGELVHTGPAKYW